MGRLDGKTAMITGASRSLGRAHATVFAREGANLLLLDLGKDEGPYPMPSRRQLEETADECRALGAQVVTWAADVRDQAQVDAGVAAAEAELGPVDVAVNNAGVLIPGGMLSHQMSDADWRLVLDINLTGTWHCCKAVLPGMAERRSGSIVNIGSTGGLVAFEMFSGYVASKHGVVGLTKALALEYGRFGVRVNVVCPTTLRADPSLGTASTQAVAAAIGASLSDYEASSASLHALRRLASAEEVVAASLWLASAESSATTGVALTVDAGYTAR
jgi:NAD(P)-dependent dehydrogenase (short-subunit alcohol dehydrogenase family)